MQTKILGLAFAALFVAISARSTARGDDVGARLGQLSANVFDSDDAERARSQVGALLRSRLQKANDASRADWAKIDDRTAWEKFASQRRAALRAGVGLGEYKPAQIKPHVTGKLDGDGYTIENIVFESRPGWFVTANLYRPATPGEAMPGIIISHSHHAPKTQGELQDMGATWARAGCVVLVPDHLGHGERQQHGFTSSSDYPHEFAVGRQDYYFRYDSSIQLYLAGHSLMGWMAHDLMRGVDVLVAQQGVDKSKIILLGGVAGGGDPCGVTAALDERIACAVPFNFGGPQPETRFPLPDDAETWFNYAGSGGWESTRHLAFSAAPNSRFLHWEITSSIAPRRLIHGHEFAWDGERDPVWKRYQKVYGFYDATENLAVAHGKGNLRGQEPEASHCGNIGEFHRRMIHPAFEKWFGIRASEFRNRHEASELAALTPEAKNELQPKLLHELLAAQVDQARAEIKKINADKSNADRREQIKARLARCFTQGVEPPAITSKAIEDQPHQFLLTIGDEGQLPLLLILPEGKRETPSPVVVALARQGKAKFLRERTDEIAKLLDAGVAVCLPDVRNTGETAADGSFGQYSSSTDRAATALMLDDPLVAGQIRDVRAVLQFLRGRNEIDGAKIALWGDSFAPINSPDTNIRGPRRIDARPRDVDALGGMLCLLTAVYEPEIKAVFIHRGLANFRGVLDCPFTYVPLDCVVPGLLPLCDLPDIHACLAPMHVKQIGSVDAYNRPIDDEEKLSPASWLLEKINP